MTGFRRLAALILATPLFLAPDLPALVLNEIMYHPAEEIVPGVEDRSFEWIEIYNQTADPLDLSGYSFVKGIDFTFPAGTYLAGREFLVVAASQQAMISKYGLHPDLVLEWRPGRSLDSAGETVALANPSGLVEAEVSYNDRGRWPAGADGTGHTLSRRSPWMEGDDPDSWTLSLERDGTPGRANFAGPDAPSNPLVLNEALFFTAGDRWIEIYNRSDAPVDLAGYSLTDDPLNLEKGTFPAPTIIPGRRFLAFTDRALGLNFSLAVPEARGKVFVALVNRAGLRVADAFTFKPSVEERSEARLPDGDREMAPAASPTPGAANRVELVGSGGVVLNEIMYHPISDDPSDEYIELFNRGPEPVNLAGFHLDRAVEFEFAERILAPGRYLVVAGDPARIAATYGLPPDEVLGPWYRQKVDSRGNPVREPASLSDRGERITLLDANGNVASTVRYAEGGEWSGWADGGGSSLELIDPSQPVDAPQAWDSSDDSQKSVPARFTYTGRHAGGDSSEAFTELQVMLLEEGIAVIDDLAVELGGSQYVTNGTFEDDAGGWTMGGTHIRSGRTDDPQLVLSGSGSLKLIATGNGDNRGNHLSTDLSAKLVAFTTASRVEYAISFNARWIVGARSLLTRGFNHGLARVHTLPIPARLGTPLAQNSVTARRILDVGEPNLGPVIDQVSFSPVVPGDGETVTVTARIRDSDGVRPGSALAWFALDSPPPSLSGWMAITMDGPDLDGLYHAAIPGQRPGTRVLFFITAEDQSLQHHPGRYPVDHSRRTHPALLDPGRAGPGDLRFVIYRHDDPAAGTPYLDYRFILDQASVDYLWTRPVLANDLVHGTLVFAAEKAYPGVGIRWSGSPFLRQPRWQNSYRVRFPGDDPLHQRTRRLDLENHGLDGRERISHYLLRYNNVPGVKVPYALQSYARWQVNGEFSGVFEEVPRPDQEYVDFWFPGEKRSDLFKLDDRFEFKHDGGSFYTGARLTYPPYPNEVVPAPDPEDGFRGWKENYRWYFNPEARVDADDYSGLIELSRLMDPLQVPDAAFDQAIGASVDVEEMLRVWAVRLNTDDWDTWGAIRGKNAYLYRRPSDGRWILIPWDMELTYQSVQSFPMGPTPSLPMPISSSFPEVSRMLNRPSIKRRYYGILKEMVDRQFNSQFLGTWMELLRANGTTFTYKGLPGDFIDQRAALIRNWIRPVVFPQVRLEVTTAGGAPVTTAAATMDISGNAPVEVARILVTVGDIPLDPQPEVRFSTTGMIGWKAVGIPLAEGLNRIGFLGYRPDSDLPLDQDSIDVTVSVGSGPRLTAVSPSTASPGDLVFISGEHFRDGLAVYMGGQKSPWIAFDGTFDATHISAIVPAGLREGMVTVKVKNPDSRESNPLDLEVRMRFIRGDVNLDARVDLSDALVILAVLYAGERPGCREALDVNHDRSLDVSDVIGLLNWLFLDGPPPAAPFPDAEISPFKETLGCEGSL